MASGGASALLLQGARSKGSIPGQRTKILQATWLKTKKGKWTGKSRTVGKVERIA